MQKTSVSKQAKNEKPDPIVGLIAAHRLAEAQHGRAVTKADRLGDWRGKEEAERALEKADREAARAMRKLCSTKPTSLRGMRALLNYLAPLYGEEMGSAYYDGRTAPLFSTLNAALVDIEHRQSL